MTSSRPYLIRAIYEWVVDNGMTPYLLVDAANEDTLVPREFVENGKIVLNVGPMAVNGLTLGNDEVSFNARFRGEPMQVIVPVQHVLAIYSRENGQGMIFSEDGDDEPNPPQGGGKDRGDRPKLRVVK
ncbi:MAG: ClpXP protease specificity-enhancing factor [Gammaproteobacteria bacterium]|jgi:stringent starvation protein B